MTFGTDLRQGQEYEKKAVNYFEYDTVEHKIGYFKEYDFTCIKNGIKTTVEVKSDRLASKTGNLCIEYECRKKPSGITSSTADYWIYFILHPEKEEVYKIPTDELRELIKGCRKVSGGDGYNSRLCLLPKIKVQKYLIMNKQ